MDIISMGLFIGIILIIILEILMLIIHSKSPKLQPHECNYVPHECKFRPEEIDIKFDFDRDFKHTHAPGLKTGEIYEFDSRVTDLIGQKIGVLCNRYHYRGILESAENGLLILSDPTIIEQSGCCQQSRPTSEDPIFTNILIKASSIEMMHQAMFIFALLPGEKGYEEQL